MKVPLLDLKQQYQILKPEIGEAINRVLEHCGFVLGPEVARLEQELAEYCDADHAIGVASGTDALLISLRSLGVGCGDEVITTAFSFFATAGVVTRLGAIPVFCDADERTFNINPDLIELKITSKTKAIMPVHLFGQVAEMNKINEIAKAHKIPVVEDAAQAIGAKYHGRPAGTLGDCAGFSFYPSKNLGAYGDGGFIATNSDELNELIRMLRVHGAKPKYFNHYVGYNSRLDTIQAAILLVKLNYLNRWHEKRRERARIYDSEFKSINDITIPYVHSHNYHIYNQYTLIVNNRDSLINHLKTKEIGYDIYYPIPLHLQKCYESLHYKEGDLPVAEKLATRVISLPVFPEMTEAQQAYVIDAIKGFYR